VLGLGFSSLPAKDQRTGTLEQEAKPRPIYTEQANQKHLNEQRNRISSDLHDNIGAQLILCYLLLA